MDYTICITTFSRRLEFVQKLVSQIRTYSDCDILIAINGDYKVEFDENYRCKMLGLCLRYKRVFPIFFPEQRGLSKLWNTLVIHSKTDWCIVLNDDVEIIGKEFFEEILIHCDKDVPAIYTINLSWSHFLVHKTLLHDMMYFDERFLGFGSEDSDFAWRYFEKYKKWIENKQLHGIENVTSNIRDENVLSSGGKYSAFNHNLLCGENHSKYVPDQSGVAVLFSHPVRKVLEDSIQYPYEEFFLKNKNLL
jgi:hypothetical protein